MSPQNIFNKAGQLVSETPCVTDGRSRTSPGFIVLSWQTAAHCTSPLTAQRLSHIRATCSGEADGSAFISAR